DSQIKPGDYIQWTSGGIDQFFRPMLVSRVVDGHVFVEDSTTGIPMKEATIVDPPNKDEQPEQKAQGMLTAVSKTGIKQDVFTVQEGSVLLQWPASMSQDSVTDIEDWLKLIVRKAKRAAGIKPDDPAKK